MAKTQLLKLKTNHLYQIIDNSDFYINPVFQEQRSICNVVFTLQNDELESKFLSGAEENGLFYLKGHRSVGGIRVSLFNSVDEDMFKFFMKFFKNYISEFSNWNLQILKKTLIITKI